MSVRTVKCIHKDNIKECPDCWKKFTGEDNILIREELNGKVFAALTSYIDNMPDIESAALKIVGHIIIPAIESVCMEVVGKKETAFYGMKKYPNNGAIVSGNLALPRNELRREQHQTLQTILNKVGK